MYAWYQQLHAPTGIENCVCCNFSSSDDLDLVVTAASQLTIYRLNKNVEVSLTTAFHFLPLFVLV